MKGNKLFLTLSILAFCSALFVSPAMASDPDSDVIHFGAKKTVQPFPSSYRATVINSFPSMSSNSWGCAYINDVWDVGPASTPDVYELDDPTGGVLQSWMSGFTYTSGVAPADPGHVWIGEWNGDSYAKYTTAGIQIATAIPTSFNIGDLAYDGTHLWTVDYWANMVHKFNPLTGGSVHSFPAPGPSGGNGCRGITYDALHNTLWISRDADSNIYQVDPVTGAVLYTITSPAIQSWGLGWDGMYLWITDHSAKILYQVDVGLTPGLSADVSTISEAKGGVVNFTLDAGKNNANKNYLMFAGISGTTPGFTPPPGLVTIPINWDIFTNLVLKLTNTTIFQNFFGVLDASGVSGAKFDTLGPFTGGAGLTVYFAYGLDPVTGYWDFASNSVSVDILP